MALLRALRCNCAGAAAVEFGFVALAFVVFMGGVVETGRAIWTSNALQFAVDQTGRYLIANPAATDDEIRAHAAGQINTVAAAGVVVAVARDSVGGVPFVTVTATYDFSPAAALLGTGILTLEGRTRVPLTS